MDDAAAAIAANAKVSLLCEFVGFFISISCSCGLVTNGCSALVERHPTRREGAWTVLQAPSHRKTRPIKERSDFGARSTRPSSNGSQAARGWFGFGISMTIWFHCFCLPCHDAADHAHVSSRRFTNQLLSVGILLAVNATAQSSFSRLNRKLT